MQVDQMRMDGIWWSSQSEPIRMVLVIIRQSCFSHGSSVASRNVSQLECWLWGSPDFSSGATSMSFSHLYVKYLTVQWMDWKYLDVDIHDLQRINRLSLLMQWLFLSCHDDVWWHHLIWLSQVDKMWTNKNMLVCQHDKLRCWIWNALYMRRIYILSLSWIACKQAHG